MVALLLLSRDMTCRLRFQYLLFVAAMFVIIVAIAQRGMKILCSHTLSRFVVAIAECDMKQREAY
jgi:hypothetical protein